MSYADKPWVKNYDEAVVSDIDYPNHSVHAFLDMTAAKHPDATAAIISMPLPLVGRKHASITYAELADQSDRLAAALADMGVKKGDRVGIVMPNCTQFAIAFYAILKAGGIVVANNPLYPPPKMQHQLKDAGAVAVITLTLFYDMLKGIQDGTDVKHMIVSNIKEYFPPLGKTLFTLAREKKDGHYVESLAEGDVWLQDTLAKYSPDDRPEVETDAKNDIALFQYTGGTTGVSKGARATHAALVSNVLQSKAWISSTSMGSEEISVAAIPLYHVYGLLLVLNYSVSDGSTMLMVPNARDIDELLGVINTFKPTQFHAVPALYNALNNHPDVIAGKSSLGSIRTCISGSAPLAPETKRRFEELSGGVIVEGYGMSEAPTATHGNPILGENKTGSIGMPFPGVECRIVSLDDETTDVPPGEAGEIVLRGPQLFSGYHNMPTETANALRDGWLYTGDIGYMDEDGYFYIVDRKKNMALIGGFNVYPNNIEKALMDHPAVADIGVAAIPHPEKEGQESLKAWVILAEDQSATDDDLVAFQKERLAPYEVVRRFEYVDDLPRTNVGKVLHRELVQQEMARQKRA
jgi:long-chain acyl-CoA synthetase